MALLKLVPNEEEISAILGTARNPRAEQELAGTPNSKPGLRKWVVVACAGWPHNRDVLQFLDECASFPTLTNEVADARARIYRKWQY